jgi:AcrR family transcriptional regulator
LQKQGYAGLTMSRIAEETGVNKSSIYSHYDSKADLLRALLEAVLHNVEEDIIHSTNGDPLRELDELLQRGIYGKQPATKDGEDTSVSDNDAEFPNQINRAFVEIRAQAAHDDIIQSRVTELDNEIQMHIEDLIRKGINEGAFKEVNLKPTANYLYTFLLGALVHRPTSTIEEQEELLEKGREYIETNLLLE